MIRTLTAAALACASFARAADFAGDPAPSGGRQGRLAHVAIAPARGVGVFLAINRFSAAGFATTAARVTKPIAQLDPR